MRTTLIITCLLLLGSFVIAEPVMTQYYSAPHPVGGSEALKKMTHYPNWAQEMRMEGQVILSFKIDSKGKVTELEVVESGGHLFNEAAMQAVKNVKWQPASHGEIPVESQYLLPFEFKISQR